MKDTTFLKQIISEYSKWTDGYAYMVPFTTAINMHCTYTFILTQLDREPQNHFKVFQLRNYGHILY